MDRAVALDDIPIPIDQVLAEYFAGDVLVCHPSEPRVAVLNATGGDVWVLIDGRRTVREIASAMAADYGIARDKSESDVSAFVATLHRRALIRFEDEHAGVGHATV